MLLWTLNRNKSYSYFQHINEVKYQTFSLLSWKSKRAWFIVAVPLQSESWLIPLGRVPFLSHWSESLCWCEHGLLHAPSPSMSVQACRFVCVTVRLCVYARVCIWMVVVCIHPPSPGAVLCIVVGMAYMLIQAWPSVVQYTRLPIPTPLPCRVRRPASFTFAPELMLVNCHIDSDLLVIFVNNKN